MSYAPWTVKGVDPEAREAAKLAARRAGVSLGVWLSQTIRGAATAQFKGQAGPVYQAPSPPDMDMGAVSAGRPPSPTLDALLESVNRLAQRIEQQESRAVEALVPLAQKVNELTQKIEKTSADKAIVSDPLERAMMRMTERLDRIESGRPSGSSTAPERSPSRRQRGFFARLFSD